jgi:hypothetical protein
MNTKQLEYIAGGVAVATLAGAAIAALQYRKNHRMYSRTFNTSAIEEVSGKVDDVIYSGRENGEDRGVEILLMTKEGPLPVHLGPAWYLDRQQTRIKTGEKVSVRGARSKMNGQDVLIAEIVKRGGQNMRLRNENGHPVWSAWEKSIG